MSSIKSVSSRSSVASSFADAAPPPNAEAPQDVLAQDIQLTTMPPWGLAQPPQVMATPPKPSLVSRVIRKPGSVGGAVGGVTLALGGVAAFATMTALACTSAKLGASWNGDSSWANEVNSGNAYGDPNQPQYGVSDQCIGIGMAMGITSPLWILALALAGSAIGGGIEQCIGAARGRRQPAVLTGIA